MYPPHGGEVSPAGSVGDGRSPLATIAPLMEGAYRPPWERKKELPLPYSQAILFHIFPLREGVSERQWRSGANRPSR